MRRKEIGVFFMEAKKETISEVAKLGVGKIVVSGAVSTPEIWQKIASFDLKGFLEFGVFVGKNQWKKYPDSRPIERAGNPLKKLGKGGWYAGVCPTQEKVREKQLKKLETLLKKLPKAQGVILDFIRFPGRWEDGIQNENYCFCPRCLDLFSKFLGKKFFLRELKAREILRDYSLEFHQWKATIIFSFIKEAAKLVKNKKIELGMFTVPYQREIYGQDLKKLSGIIDTFYLMAYHKLLGFPIEQIRRWVKEAKQETSKKVVPVIQAFPEPPVATSEFKKSLEQTEGEVMIFFWEALEKEKKKVIIEKLKNQ